MPSRRSSIPFSDTARCLTPAPGFLPLHTHWQCTATKAGHEIVLQCEVDPCCQQVRPLFFAGRQFVHALCIARVHHPQPPPHPLLSPPLPALLQVLSEHFPGTTLIPDIRCLEALPEVNWSRAPPGHEKKKHFSSRKKARTFPPSAVPRASLSPHQYTNLALCHSLTTMRPAPGRRTCHGRIPLH